VVIHIQVFKTFERLVTVYNGYRQQLSFKIIVKYIG